MLRGLPALARDAVTACKGPRASRLAYAHKHHCTRTPPTARHCVITPIPLPPPGAVAAGHLWCARYAIAALPKQRQCPRCGGPCLGEPASSPAARAAAAMGTRYPARCGWTEPLGALDARWAQCGREGVACTVAKGEMAAYIAGALAQHRCALAKVGQPLSRALRWGCLAAACARPS